MIAAIEQLELLRPGWLLALLPWLIWVLHSHLSRTRDPRWSQVIEPELLDALATGPATGGHDWVDRLSRWALRLAVLLQHPRKMEPPPEFRLEAGDNDA